MNCPFHILIHKSACAATKPAAAAELRTVYRYERSGVLLA